MFKQHAQHGSDELAFASGGFNGGVGALSLAQAITTPLRAPASGFKFAEWFDDLRSVNWVPDLGQDIGSRDWFRGLAVLVGLTGLTVALSPGLPPLAVAPDTRVNTAEANEYRTQMILPLAYGGDTGRTMAPNEAVIALAHSPERPSIELSATLGQGDSFARVLQRAGVGGKEAGQLAALVSNVMPLGDLKPGTRMEVVLGRRPSRNMARPLDSIAFRARFDLNLEVNRVGGALQLVRKPIVVDDTPLRIRGTVGSSLYRSARAAGAPAKAVQAYLKTLSTQMSVGNDIRSTDEYDLIVSYKRAETGEIEVGDLLYAGLERGGKAKAQMLRWTSGGATQWYEASGVGEQRGQLSRPVSGAITSGYGMRRHPILGYKRMHNGLDFKARYGEPIHAASDGVVSYAGRKGGYGNYVQIKHGGGLASGYGHMSRFAVSSGTRVRAGQVIGYVGSTGLSTGAHLHYELYRNGRAINPQSVTFTLRAQLSGQDLRNFKAKLAGLKAIAPGAALTEIKPRTSAVEQEREIDRLSKPR